MQTLTPKEEPPLLHIDDDGDLIEVYGDMKDDVGDLWEE